VPLNDPFDCPKCGRNYFEQVYEEFDWMEEFIDETITCDGCGTKLRIFEENDFGDWTQEVVDYKDPNQTEILI
jgi:predicted  nucleic acid-binding Zn-ribbon protein